ncbi:MAG: protein kinase [Myxococcales bacterium]|nr:protein kinase [Myxococcales bacterium]
MASRANQAGAGRVGSVLKDKWRLDALLGVGGMAWVYAATHRNKNRVAIKLLFPELSSNDEVRKRFLREGYAANSIGHPGAVQVFDDDVTDDGLVFLVMELLEGKTLADLRRERGGRLDPKLVLTSADGVLDVLSLAHEKGVIHRDIKPGNVFLTSNRGIKVVDFGIARVAEANLTGALTSAGHLLGSAAFMAPEQAAGQWGKVDARTDLYAVGATMFQLLVGRPVHEGATPQDRIIAAVSEPARSIGSVLPSLPKSVVDVVDRALEFDQARRWQSAREMQQAVRQALKRMDALGSTLVMDGPEPLASSPVSDKPRSPAVVQPEPAPPAIASEAVAPASPRRQPVGLGATRVYGSPEDAAALRTVRERMAQAEAAAAIPAPAPIAPSAPTPAPAPAPTHAAAPLPMPRPHAPAAVPVRAPAPPGRPRRLLLIPVILFMLGAMLLALAGAGLWLAKVRGPQSAPAPSGP